jgi:hypothetical protein
VVALSSMEAELNAIVKGVAEVLGLKNLLAECGRIVKAVIFTDSSAANGVVHRQGSGKVKHLECRQLWVQDAVFSGKVRVEKVGRDFNPADAFTHYTSVHEATRHFKAIGLIDPAAVDHAQRHEQLQLCEPSPPAPKPDQSATLDTGAGRHCQALHKGSPKSISLIDPNILHFPEFDKVAASSVATSAASTSVEGGCYDTPSQAPLRFVYQTQLQLMNLSLYGFGSRCAKW